MIFGFFAVRIDPVFFPVRDATGGLVLASLLTPQALSIWGWRAAMLLGAGVVPLALAIRRHLPETMEQRDRTRPPRPTLAQIGAGLLTLMTLASATITSYVLFS